MAHQENQLIKKQHHCNTSTECLFSRSTFAVKSNMNNDIIQIYIHKQLLKNSYIINNECTKLMFLFRTVTNIAKKPLQMQHEMQIKRMKQVHLEVQVVLVMVNKKGPKQKKLTMQTTMMLNKQENLQRRGKWMPSKNDF